MKVGIAAVSAFVMGAGLAWGQGAPITLSVDLRDAPKKILHATETIPVQPGAMTLAYPKWIPGEHMPSGPIDDQAGFLITGNGQPIRWERDPIDMFAYHLTVPAGVTSLTVKMDFLATPNGGSFTAGGSTSANLAVLSWNTLVVYPYSGPTMKASDVMIAPSVTLPEGWHYGTALEPTGGGNSAPGDQVGFKTVSLEQLIDSPVLTGRFFKEIPLAPEVTPKHYLDIVADGPEDLAINQAHIDDFSKLVRETGALYQSRHFTAYHFLVTLSDETLHFGLEHHQSSDDRIPPDTFTNDHTFVEAGDLLPHEFTHSWNGKYRRPAGLATPNYQVPMVGDGLWVYEGLTEYLGDVLAARCGIWTPEQFRDRLAEIAAKYDNRPGRTWRDLQDTARMAQVLYTVGGPYDNWRLGTDFYEEGELVWLDVDTTIRSKTNGRKTLNDFVAAFHGLGGNTGPKVVPYTFEDVVAGLNAVVPMDWAGFLNERLHMLQAAAPLGGITNGGYKLVYKDKMSAWSEASGGVDFWYSLGLHVSGKGQIRDVLVGGLGDKAGFGPGMTIVAVNGRAFSTPVLRAAIVDAKESQAPTEFIVENTGFYKVIKMDYHQGEKFPVFERVSGVPDRLDEILKPMVK
ncbi:M61 family metallopeptidase [Granulicella tundricola]|uniref:Peptidase M61 domain protein n=1 Tax=Granulicella tundricola (strain ATCC BAA-1859 / DSM 23138 / MP5ACTX9) TaxID=1198114 RepID=E8X237_GRATM|nr:M61 family metallopeptidase [Granulicella tundricola]ADW70280.1 peptidase M61 domain protein [Granulicella tundricola MP5ACTX9]